MISLSEAALRLLVRGNSGAEVARQALAGLRDGQEAVDVRAYGPRHPTD